MEITFEKASSTSEKDLKYEKINSDTYFLDMIKF